MIYRHIQDGSLWEVEDDGDDYVSCHAQGGGFVYTMPRYIFEEQLVPIADSPFGEYRTGTVWGDWMDEGETYPCYLTNQKRNGWAIPYFTKDVADRLMLESVGQITYVAEKDAYQIEDGCNIDEPQFAMGLDIVVDGKTIHVYQIGDGWCWDEV